MQPTLPQKFSYQRWHHVILISCKHFTEVILSKRLCALRNSILNVRVTRYISQHLSCLHSWVKISIIFSCHWALKTGLLTGERLILMIPYIYPRTIIASLIGLRQYMTNSLLIFFSLLHFMWLLIISLLHPSSLKFQYYIFLHFKIYRKLNFLEARAFFLPKTVSLKYNKMHLLFHNFSFKLSL